MSAPMSHQRPQLAPGDILVVIHDFDARGDDELNLRKADRIQLMELDDGFGDGWYLGRHLRLGTTGLFPGGISSPSPLLCQLSNSSTNCSPVYTAKLPPNFTPVGATYPASPSFPYAPRPDQSLANDRPLPSSPMTDQTIHRQATSSPTSTSNVRPALPPTPTSFTQPIQRSIGQTLAHADGRQDSPVMNETLSVIDEHITDLSTPRQSSAAPRLNTEDSESDYSSHLDHTTHAYIVGPETDTEDTTTTLTEADVKRWNPRETADHLRSLGVDARHCDIFEEQEITGDVLLEMDQSFINMKEYDFGLMGRRLKTWHKIRDLQLEVRGTTDSRKPSVHRNPSYQDQPPVHTRAPSNTTILPKIPNLMQEPGLSLRQSQHPPPSYSHHATPVPPSPLEAPLSPNSLSRANVVTGTPPSPFRASMAADHSSRPSAALVRELTHSRRHSSIDFAKNITSDLSPAPAGPAHQKIPSLDRDWSLSNATTAGPGTSTPSLRLHTGTKQHSVDLAPESPLEPEGSGIELDRGYFSGNEVDNRKIRSYLRRREGPDSADHSRQSSLMDESAKLPATRHSRISSVDSSRDRITPGLTPAAKAYHSRTYKGRVRSASSKSLSLQQSPMVQSPTVTNLEDETTSGLSSPRIKSGGTSPAMPPPRASTTTQMARKFLGMRAASEAVTGNEKDAAHASKVISDPLVESPVASPSGSQTPSVTSRSLEVENTDNSSKGTLEHLAAAGPLLHTKAPTRTKPKTKQQTSAYKRGLLHLSPAEARQHCDYHGWMKKKSSGLMATWKPRLFILRGRRLSYYYAETDTEERGIIDISGHKVLVANSDPIIALHATLTGASTSLSPTMGVNGSPADMSPDMTRSSSGGSPFYFKLVPPKAGSSRAVQFTRPTVYYFQVDNITQGRKWMGEIMKATIEHDLSSYETTNRQKTISLAKARARKERPPALKGTETPEATPEATPELSELTEKPPLGDDIKQSDTKQDETGLNIQGLEFDDSKIDLRLDPTRVSIGPLDGQADEQGKAGS
ncbi:hypothetical protein PV10_00622 [Exophiala mesophila]|uniref:Polarized growth protein Boi2 n=1 Tax=Exophiala mesophila TaxID=212818 RepID=A0A0D1X4T5_EXOME|nr:uncharacterized protein PV10_00622 [Exophiala mesophila]KIV96805.1 hypothetical protein PV10_00622 [Exophiala mesophila]